MAIRRICKYGESVLREKTRPVDFEKIKRELPDLLSDMWQTCEAVKGVGLAANQIGLDYRLAVIVIKGEDCENRFVLINPKITKKSGEMFEDEGCLSFPGLFVKVKRFFKVTAHALNEKGIPVEITAEGLLAKAIQHEVDHLDGKFFIDRAEPILKNKIKSAIKEMKKDWAEMDESKMVIDENDISGNP
jgi:peptide deformylase